MVNCTTRSQKSAIIDDTMQHNHFIASMRLLKNEKDGRRIIKRYDKSRTPYMRVLEKMKEGTRKERFIKLHESLNPWTIQK